jgi:hypothetical protein
MKPETLIVLAQELPKDCGNPYCDRGVCHGPRNPKPHACKACVTRAKEVL